MKISNNIQKYQSSHITTKELHRIWWCIHQQMESDQPIWPFPPNISKLCKTINTNQKYLSQTINQATGMTIVSFFQTYRIEKFIQKINAGEAQLKTIEGLLLEVGFQNRSSFYRAFKNFIGIHPTQFIQVLKEED